MTDLFDQALAYAARGWPVFPLHTPIRLPGGGVRCSCSKGEACRKQDIGKHPRTKHGFKDATLDPVQIRAWWEKHPDANVGIATGAGSNIVVIDIDPRNGGADTLEQLEAEHGKLPHTVESLTGGGGRHLFFRHPGGVVRCDSYGKVLGAGIDIKGDGGFIVAPPSMHSSGNRYAWEWSSDPEETPIAEMPEWLRKRVQTEPCDRDTENTEIPKGPICVSEDSVRSVNSVDSVVSVVSVLSVSSVQRDQILILLRKHVPVKGGQRRHCLFQIARGMKFNLGLGSRPVEDFFPLIRAWHAEVWPRTSREKTADDSVMDFEEAWRSATVPLGGDLAKIAFGLARADPPPRIAAKLFTDPNRLLLAAVCRRMQLLVGDKEFFLSTRQVSTGLGYTGSNPPSFGHRLLGNLAGKGILKVVNSGKPGGGGKDSAARWRYLASDLHDLDQLRAEGVP